MSAALEIKILLFGLLVFENYLINIIIQKEFRVGWKKIKFLKY